MFQDVLQQRRKQIGLSQQDLASSMKISRQAVSKWEQGTYPETEMVLFLAVKLDISLDELFADELEYYRGNKKADQDFLARHPGMVCMLKNLANYIDKTKEDS